MTVRRFRALMGANLALGMAPGVVALLREAGVLEPGMSDALRQLASAEKSPARVFFEGNALAANALIAVAICALLAIIAGFIGMANMRRAGRSVSLWTTVAAYTLLLFHGPHVQSALDYMLEILAAMLWCACLVLAYYSPVASEFR